MIEKLLNLDSSMLLFIQERIRNPILTPIFTVITHLGDGGAIWIIASMGLLCSKKTRETGVMALGALTGSVLINNVILKNLVCRLRPFDVIYGLVPLIPKPQDYSFPSGHTAASFAAGCILFRRLPKRYGIWALVLAVLIACSRIYLGVHYPSDVLFGMLSGIGISYFTEYSVRLFREYFSEHMKGENH